MQTDVPLFFCRIDMKVVGRKASGRLPIDPVCKTVGEFERSATCALVNGTGVSVRWTILVPAAVSLVGAFCLCISADFMRCLMSLILSDISAILAFPSGVLHDGQLIQSDN